MGGTSIVFNTQIPFPNIYSIVEALWDEIDFFFKVMKILFCLR